jgi:hypothetical protein
VRHCGWWPDHVLRLFRRGSASFSDDTVHERVVVAGRIARLIAPIEHDAISDPADAEDKIERYAAAAAAELAANGKRSSRNKAALRAAGAFLRTYLWRAGFLDGRTGWRVADYNCRYTYRKWARLATESRKSKP